MSNANEARELVARAHTKSRSRLSTIPIVKVGEEYRAGALPIEWKDDLEPMARTRLVIDENGTREETSQVTIAFLDECEETIEKAGGIENVMVIPDGMDPDVELKKITRKLESDQAREFYRRWYGWDV